MEIKQITMEEAREQAEAELRDRAEGFSDRLRDEGEEAIRHLRDAADGIEALNAGPGTLIDRAVAIFAATFHIEGTNDVPIGGAELRFPFCSYCVTLDHSGGCRDGTKPKLAPNRRYRAIVILEPIE